MNRQKAVLNPYPRNRRCLLPACARDSRSVESSGELVPRITFENEMSSLKADRSEPFDAEAVTRRLEEIDRRLTDPGKTSVRCGKGGTGEGSAFAYHLRQRCVFPQEEDIEGSQVVVARNGIKATRNLETANGNRLD